MATMGDLAVAFTGVLDNADEVAGLAGVDGATDPAVVVASLFRRSGDRAFQMLRGAFAIVVSDGTRMWASHDHVGYRSLFYRVDGLAATVASEAKQVAAGAGLSREPNLDVLERIFFGQYDNDTPSAIRGVMRLPKASTLCAGPEGTRSARYWHPEQQLETGRYSPSEIQERFDELMQQACRRMLVGRDAVALSGGIDSPAIAAYAAPEYLRRFGEPLVALTAIFPEQPSVNELPYVETVVDALGLRLHTYEQRLQPLHDAQNWVDLFDGPVPLFMWPDTVTHYSTAHALGIRNTLNGGGAEIVMDLRRYLLAHLMRRGKLSAARREIERQLASGVGRRSVAREAASGFAPGWLRAAGLQRRLSGAIGHVPSWLDAGRVNAAVIGHTRAGGDPWDRLQISPLLGPIPTMEANEVVQQACGVRARYPWADVELWEFFLSLPAEVKFPGIGSKALVRRLLRGRVPDAILDRKDKTVFNDSLKARLDYAGLRRWLCEPPEHIAGVDYRILRDRLEAADMDLHEFLWARDLASVHAFLDLFD
jgi:asparagine synthetase B (glutamine-hydrolysing)